MKKIIIAVALIIGMASCKKQVINIVNNCPDTTLDSGIVIKTHFITIQPDHDLYTGLRYNQDGTTEYFPISECGYSFKELTFCSGFDTKVDIYKAGDFNQGFIWQGTIRYNPTDSSYIINELGSVDAVVYNIYSCGTSKKLVVFN